VLSLGNQFSLLNYSVCNELGCSLSNSVVCYEWVFAPELCCLLGINVRCRITVLAMNQVFPVELWCLQRMSVPCRLVLSEANQRPLLNYSVCSESAFPVELCCLPQIKCLPSNYGVCAVNELLLFNCVVCRESVFAVELWCLQRKLQRLSFYCRMCCLQRISFCSWITVFVANHCSLQNYCVYSESGVCCRILVSTTNERSLLNYIVSNESVFEAEFWCLRWRSFRCWIVLSAGNQGLLPNCVVCSE
jgi:hypothetical protein